MSLSEEEKKMSRLLVIKDVWGIRKAGLAIGMTPGKRLRVQQSRDTGLGNAWIEQPVETGEIN